jgi:hypothetical protein
MKHHPTFHRVWLTLALVLPLSAAFAVGALQAQQGGNQGPGGPGMPGGPGAPNFPKPPGGNPKNPGGGMGGIQKVWICSKCGKQVGTGMFPPANCPFCNTKFINGVGKGGDRPLGPDNNQPKNPGGGPPGNPNNPGGPPGNPNAPNNPGAPQGAPNNPGPGNPAPNNPGGIPNNQGGQNNGDNANGGNLPASPPVVSTTPAAPRMATGVILALVAGGVVTLGMGAAGIGLIVWLCMAGGKPGKVRKRSSREWKLADDRPRKDGIRRKER